jgi:uncharacterized protein YqeY
MATESQLQADLRSAMKARAMDKVYVLRSVIAAVKNLKVEKRTEELPEAEISAIIRKEANKRAEAADFARKAERAELIDENERQRAILESYLPQQLDAEALQTKIREIADELGTTQIGPIMGKLRERFAGQYDGKLASELIRNLG